MMDDGFKKYRISDIARELQVSPQEVLQFVKQEGSKVASTSSMVDQGMREMIFGYFSVEKKMVDETLKIRQEKQRRLKKLGEQTKNLYELERQRNASLAEISIKEIERNIIDPVNKYSVIPINENSCSDYEAKKVVYRKDVPRQLEKMRVLLLMPFSEDYDEICYGIKSLIASMGMVCKRVDDMQYNHLVLSQIYDSIKDANFIVADMSGKNANVFYEVGYAHALSKEVILVVQKEADIPFNLQGFNFIIYKDLEMLRSKLKKRLQQFKRSK